ncbi:PREDICTED: uncharacterized protein LOC109350448 [Lupinus angustifolius]|uniref:uncharacterized protein LOC109350447 n=1 Tax=Lupinus angustifolius TaxID=3871 RepID=UPI00092F43B3|nr:PREDICTED: uncharacterized protein LOC109350447 [Lupinus angustifolius]XP_019447230.1 PREDICTED: uncharacterized protein LOC109350448 [Lupinus angustifolius]
MEYNARLHSKSGNTLEDTTAYRRLIGRLLYLTHTRPDISFAVGFLSQYLASPTDLHHKAATRILRHKEVSDRMVLLLRDNLISWKSKRQNTISRSSSEAEYRAFVMATCEAQWLIYLYKDLGIPHPTPISIFCDNNSAL